MIADGQSAPLGTAFMYQGQLKDGGVPVTDMCDFQFTLWDDPDSVNPADQVGPTVTFDGDPVRPNPAPVDVVNGRFQISLDFGPGAITGQARWLEIEVCCSSPCSPGFTTLVPRQELTPTPNALALPGLWTEENATSPNLIGGFHGNRVTAGVFGATIAGGGEAGSENVVTDDHGTIGGGTRNLVGTDDVGSATAPYATVGGGIDNQALAEGATIGGGGSKRLGGGLRCDTGPDFLQRCGVCTHPLGFLCSADSDCSSVGGGVCVPNNDNCRAPGVCRTGVRTVGNRVMASWGTIAGGTQNHVAGTEAAVGGGRDNVAGASNGTIAGGVHNVIANLAFMGTIGGGASNTVGTEDVFNGQGSTICGGIFNEATNNSATIGGGQQNGAHGYGSTVGGGLNNTASGERTTVGGGSSNMASGGFSTVPGGGSNTAAGDYSFAAGRQAKANHQGSFVWADSDGGSQFAADFVSTGPDQFLIRANGGVGIGTNSPTAGAKLDVDGDIRCVTLTETSSRSLKENIAPIEGALETVSRLQGVRFQWTESYGGKPDLGFVAEDVADVLPELVSWSEEGVKANGLKYGHMTALAIEAIKDLRDEVRARDEKIDDLTKRLERMEATITQSTSRGNSPPLPEGSP